MNKLNILYEDNHIIVVVKPYNVLSQSDITNDSDMITLIKNYLREKYHKPGNIFVGLVHRLDRVTTGIMVFAKTSKAASRLSNDIRLNNFHKYYLAIINGKIKDNDTYIDYLEKCDDYNTIITDKTKGKYSELSYQLLEYNEKRNLSLVEVNLKTGRHHQIRVQFESRGYPLYADNRYGLCEKDELGLCAYKLAFIHPTLKKEMTFTYYPNNSVFRIFEYINNAITK